jgi:hypothetical protein
MSVVKEYTGICVHSKGALSQVTEKEGRVLSCIHYVCVDATVPKYVHAHIYARARSLSLSQVGRVPMKRHHMKPFFTEYDAKKFPKNMEPSPRMQQIAQVCQCQ